MEVDRHDRERGSARLGSTSFVVVLDFSRLRNFEFVLVGVGVGVGGELSVVGVGCDLGWRWGCIWI